MFRAVTAVAAIALTIAAPVSEAKKHPPKGPSVATAKAAIAPVLAEGYAPLFGGPEDVDVKYTTKLRVLKARKVDPYAGTPNHAGGKIWTWPVRVSGLLTVHRADGSVSKTCKFGTWANQGFDFYRSARHTWAWSGTRLNYHVPIKDYCTYT